MLCPFIDRQTKKEEAGTTTHHLVPARAQSFFSSRRSGSRARRGGGGGGGGSGVGPFRLLAFGAWRSQGSVPDANAAVDPRDEHASTFTAHGARDAVGQAAPSCDDGHHGFRSKLKRRSPMLA